LARCEEVVMNGFKDRVSFVTGAGRSIGRAIAVRLAAEGAEVAVADFITGRTLSVSAGLTMI
jgi:NAD(P)-dependent dehydrogenase (short-subunit alcohol dehydrogenase family)